MEAGVFLEFRNHPYTKKVKERISVNEKILIQAAMDGLKYSYAPYSNFNVAAALLGKSGEIYVGCNIENAALSPGMCAERVAFAKAISSGEKEFTAIAIVGGKDGECTQFCFPCGVCRQVMMEFCNPKEFKIIAAINIDEYEIYTLEQLLPNAFGPGTVSV